MLGVKREHQSFTFEYKLKVIARADNFVSLFLGAGYLLVQVIC